MTPYELWSLSLAALALGVAAFALVRAYEAIKLSRENNALTRQQIEQTESLNIPNVIFGDCETTIIGGTQFTMQIPVFNSGSHVAQIKKGEVRLNSYQYPEVKETEVLNGIKIAGRSQHVAKLKSKAPVIESTGSGIRPAEIICEAFYTRPNQTDGEAREHYVYDRSKRKFVKKLD